MEKRNRIITENYEIRTTKYEKIGYIFNKMEFTI